MAAAPEEGSGQFADVGIILPPTKPSLRTMGTVEVIAVAEQQRSQRRGSAESIDATATEYEEDPNSEVQRRWQEQKAMATHESMDKKVAFEYNINQPLRALFLVKGTFWPMVFQRHELYLYPLVHIGLVVWAHQYRHEHKNDPGYDPEKDHFYEQTYTIPWASLSLLSPLMIFVLVFFLSNCYARFTTFAGLCSNILCALQEVTLQSICHIENEQDRWDIVRYMTAGALIIYFRVTHVADGKSAAVSAHEWERLLSDEQAYLGLDDDRWDELMGWGASRKVEEAQTALLHRELKIARTIPERKASVPALLTVREVDELRKYPGSKMTFVCISWAMQVAKKTGRFPGPAFNALQASCFQLSNANANLTMTLGLPVPLPYFHTLNFLQNVNYSIYCFALLDFESNLTPIVLFVVILITIGMQDVAACLSNPFGHDDVDFPIHKWIVQLRSFALVAHPRNNSMVPPVFAAPPPAATPPRSATPPPAKDPSLADASTKEDQPRKRLEISKVTLKRNTQQQA